MNRDALKVLLEDEEGRCNTLYPDSKGFLTIGIGHLVDPKKGGRISDRVIDFILDEDISEKYAELTTRIPWAATSGMGDARFNVLLAVAFQLGVGGLLKFTNFLTYTRAGQYDLAADEMLDSKWARTDSPERARRMAAIFRRGGAA